MESISRERRGIFGMLKPSNTPKPRSLGSLLCEV